MTLWDVSDLLIWVRRGDKRQLGLQMMLFYRHRDEGLFRGLRLLCQWCIDLGTRTVEHKLVLAVLPPSSKTTNNRPASGQGPLTRGKKRDAYQNSRFPCSRGPPAKGYSGPNRELCASPPRARSSQRQSVPRMRPDQRQLPHDTSLDEAWQLGARGF
jgi:hypothetical protein